METHTWLGTSQKVGEPTMGGGTHTWRRGKLTQGVGTHTRLGNSHSGGTHTGCGNSNKVRKLTQVGGTHNEWGTHTGCGNPQWAGERTQGEGTHPYMGGVNHPESVIHPSGVTHPWGQFSQGEHPNSRPVTHQVSEGRCNSPRRAHRVDPWPPVARAVMVLTVESAGHNNNYISCSICG